MTDLNKKFYKIGDVADFLGVAQATLRYWEGEFPMIAPQRTPSGQRLYTPEDVENLRIVHYLVKTKGLKLEAAKAQLRQNKRYISRKLKVIAELEEVRGELTTMLKALTKRR